MASFTYELDTTTLKTHIIQCGNCNLLLDRWMTIPGKTGQHKPHTCTQCGAIDTFVIRETDTDREIARFVEGKYVQ
jgi:hypothetical protein